MTRCRIIAYILKRKKGFIDADNQALGLFNQPDDGINKRFIRTRCFIPFSTFVSNYTLSLIPCCFLRLLEHFTNPFAMRSYSLFQMLKSIVYSAF